MRRRSQNSTGPAALVVAALALFGATAVGRTAAAQQRAPAQPRGAPRQPAPSYAPQLPPTPPSARPPGWDDEEEEPAGPGGVPTSGSPPPGASPWQAAPQTGLQAAPAPSRSGPAGRFLDSRFAAAVQLLTGRMTGLAGEGYDLSSPGYGFGLSWRFLHHLGLELGLSLPSASLAPALPQPLQADSTMHLWEGGARVYLAREGRVAPWFGLGYSTFTVDTTYNEVTLTRSTQRAKMSTGGKALRFALGLEVELVRFPVFGQELGVAATASARYLLTRWEAMYCFDQPLLVEPDGSTRKCAYENGDGAFGRSDLLLADLGVALTY